MSLIENLSRFLCNGGCNRIALASKGTIPLYWVEVAPDVQYCPDCVDRLRQQGTWHWGELLGR